MCQQHILLSHGFQWWSWGAYQSLIILPKLQGCTVFALPCWVSQYLMQDSQEGKVTPLTQEEVWCSAYEHNRVPFMRQLVPWRDNNPYTMLLQMSAAVEDECKSPFLDAGNIWPTPGVYSAHHRSMLGTWPSKHYWQKATSHLLPSFSIERELLSSSSHQTHILDALAKWVVKRYILLVNITTFSN